MEPLLKDTERITVRQAISGLQTGRDYMVEITRDNYYKFKLIHTHRRVSDKSIRFDVTEIDALIGSKIILKPIKRKSNA